MAIVSLFAVLSFVALAIDRRALLVSSLLYLGYASSQILAWSGVASENAGLSILIVGGTVLVLSVAWQPLRRLVLKMLPRLPSGCAYRQRRNDTMPDTPAITFVPVAHEHLPMLHGWLCKPHIREWWGEPETELGYIVDMVEGRDSTKPYIFHVNGEPTGYIQVWFVGPHQTEEWSKDNPWLMELPSHAVGVDLSIGEAEQAVEGNRLGGVARVCRQAKGRRPHRDHH